MPWENRQGNRERQQESKSKEENIRQQRLEGKNNKYKIYTARRRGTNAKNLSWRCHGISRINSHGKQAGGGLWLPINKQNLGMRQQDPTHQLNRDPQIFTGRWWWWSFPAHLNSTQTTLQFCRVSLRHSLSEGNSTIVFYLFPAFAAFALTWQLPKSIVTCKQTWELTDPTWKIREFQKTALDFPSATRHQEVQELSVPQLSCWKNLLIQGSQLPLLQNPWTLSWTHANSHFWKEKWKSRGILKPWVGTDNNWALRWYMKLRDLSGEGEALSPSSHNQTMVHFWCYFCTETNFRLLSTW